MCDVTERRFILLTEATTKSDLDQIPKKASQHNSQHVLVSNNEILFGFVTLSL